MKKRTIILLAAVVLGLANLITPFRVEHLHIDLRPSILAHIGPLPISNTLIASLLATVLLAIFALFARRNLVDVPPLLARCKTPSRRPLNCCSTLCSALRASRPFVSSR